VFDKLSPCLSVRWQKMALLVLRRVGLCVGQNQMCHLWVGFLACALTVSVYEKLGTSEHGTVKPIKSLKRATTLDFSSICPIFYIPCYALAVLVSVCFAVKLHFHIKLVIRFIFFSVCVARVPVRLLADWRVLIFSLKSGRKILKFSLGWGRHTLWQALALA